VKAGKTPDEWKRNPAKNRQKDRYARRRCALCRDFAFWPSLKWHQ
jgi:hypothetical protein